MKFIRTLFIFLIGMISLTAFGNTSELEQKSNGIEVVKDFDLGVSIETAVVERNLFTNHLKLLSYQRQNNEVNKETNYKAGDKFKGPNGEEITLIKTKKGALGIKSWKAEWRLNGKKQIVYLTYEYLEQCELLPKTAE